MRDYLFDDWRSIFHGLYGVLGALLVFKGFGAISAIMFVIYLLYELSEQERPVATVGDVFEYVIGYLLADMVFHSSEIFDLIIH